MAVPSVASGGEQQMEVEGLALIDVATWSPSQPALLTALACLDTHQGTHQGTHAGECVQSCDSALTSTSSSALSRVGADASLSRAVFGVRTFSFSARDGFTINGQPLKLRGVRRRELQPIAQHATPPRARSHTHAPS